MSRSPKNLTGEEVARMLRQNGWELDRITGSHHVFRKHGVMVVVPIHGAKTLKVGTLNAILKQAGLK